MKEGPDPKCPACGNKIPPSTWMKRGGQFAAAKRRVRSGGRKPNDKEVDPSTKESK